MKKMIDGVEHECSAEEEAEIVAGWIANTQANPPLAPPITTVTMRQARLALLGAGLLTTVNAAVAGMPGAQGDAARIEWEFSSSVERHRPLITALAAGLGLTDAQLDSLFVTAAAL